MAFAEQLFCLPTNILTTPVWCVDSQVKNNIGAAAAEVRKVIQECEAAKSAGTLDGMSIASPQACSGVVTNMRKAEAIIKTMFATMDRC